MKWYLHTHHNIHLQDIRVKRGDPMEVYIPWVSQIANTFTRDGVAIGALNYQDLLQAGYVGLVEAWTQLDHERDPAEKWSYVKKRIKWAIRREIDNHGAFIKVPRRNLEDHRKNLTATDKILVTVFPKFFDKRMMVQTYDIRPWKIEQLQNELEDYLYHNYKNYHINILFDSYGIDIDKPLTMKELAKKYKTSANYINQVKIRLIKHFKEDEVLKKINEKYNEN